MSAIEFKTGVIRPIECFKEGWELIKDQYWLFLGVCLVGGLLAGFSMYILFGAMFCGIFYCFLKKANNQPIEIPDLFKGFDYFKPSLIVALFFIVPNLLLMFLQIGLQVAAPIIFRESGNANAIWTILGIYLVIALILAVVMTCIHALIIFAFPLIVEHKLSAMDALKTSARASWANIGGIVALILCQIVLTIAGLLACYFGIFFVIPIIFAGFFVAYRKVFPSNQAGVFDAPPSPGSFQDAGQPFNY